MPLKRAYLIICVFTHVASEKSELLIALTEYEKDIILLESLYNNNKELLDQQNLDTDLKELAEYACLASCSRLGLTMAQNHTRPRQLAELNHPEPGKEEATES